MKAILQKLKNREFLVLFAVLLIVFVFHFPSLGNEAYELYADWRQTDTYSIALNYIQYNMNPLAPQFNYDGTSDIYVQLELQIIPYISALIFLLIGQATPFIPRVISLLFYLGSTVYLYKLIRKFVSSPAALMTVLIYLFMPISLLYSRAIMPESCAVFFLCGSLYYLLNWYDNGDKKAIWLSAIFMAFAIMQKIPAAFAGLLVLFVFIWREKGKCLRNPAFWGYGVISLCVPAAYYVYSSTNATMSYVDGIATKHIFTHKLFELFSPATIGFFKGSLPTWLGIGVLICAVAGFVLCFSRKNKPILVWAIAFFLETVTIIAVIKFDYYLIFLAPVLAALCGICLDKLWTAKKAISLVVFVLVFGLTVFKSVPHYREVVHENGEVQIIADSINEVTNPDDVIAIAASSPTCINAANRHGYRANIKYHAHIPVGPEAETNYYIEQGVSYFVAPYGTVNDDPDYEYINYLNDNFPIIFKNDQCTIFSLEERF